MPWRTVIAAAALVGLLCAADGAGSAAPRSERLVFESNLVSGGALYTSAPDGRDLRPVPHGGDAHFPRLSPDGKKVAFMRYSTDWDIISMNLDGTGRAALTDDTAYDGLPAWSPDGKRIAFTHGTATTAYGIWVMNADGNEKTYLGPGFSPSWSPDGSKIVFDDGSDLFDMNADGSGVVRLTATVEEQETSPAWSPDGTRIAFVRLIYTMDIPHHVIVVRTLGTDEERYVWSDYPVEEDGPRWSPDGSRVAFNRRTQGNADVDVYSATADGGLSSPLWKRPSADHDADWGLIPTRLLERCLVPKVIGLQLKRARSRITRAHCSVGRVRTVRSHRVGRILAEAPPAGSERPVGAKVRLVVGRL